MSLIMARSIILSALGVVPVASISNMASGRSSIHLNIASPSIRTTDIIGINSGRQMESYSICILI